MPEQPMSYVLLGGHGRDHAHKVLAISIAYTPAALHTCQLVCLHVTVLLLQVCA